MKEAVLKIYPNAMCNKEYYGTEGNFTFVVSFDKTDDITSILGMGNTETLAWENVLNTK